MVENTPSKFRTPLIVLGLGVLIAAASLLADLVGVSAPGLGQPQWIALCLGAILIILGLAMLLAAFPDP